MSTVGHSDGPRHRQLEAVPAPDAEAVPTQATEAGPSLAIEVAPTLDAETMPSLDAETVPTLDPEAGTTLDTETAPTQETKVAASTDLAGAADPAGIGETAGADDIDEDAPKVADAIGGHPAADEPVGDLSADDGPAEEPVAGGPADDGPADERVGDLPRLDHLPPMTALPMSRSVRTSRLRSSPSRLRSSPSRPRPVGNARPRNCWHSPGVESPATTRSTTSAMTRSSPTRCSCRRCGCSTNAGSGGCPGLENVPDTGGAVGGQPLRDHRDRRHDAGRRGTRPPSAAPGDAGARCRSGTRHPGARSAGPQERKHVGLQPRRRTVAELRRTRIGVPRGVQGCRQAVLPALQAATIRGAAGSSPRR